MPASSPSSLPTDPFEIAERLGLLTAVDLAPLRSACREGSVTALEALLGSGLLDAVEVDIVRTLSAPETTVPGYRIETLIGKGGMGVVYRAEQLNLGRTVALKTILVSRMSEQGSLDRFEQEARTIGQLRHPNIIIAHDFGRHAGRVYLAMELIEGTDLDQRLRRQGRLGEAVVWGLLRQTASGLAHAAQQHVVHRDIKPANLMLVDPPEGYPLPAGVPMVKIADFGLAFLRDDAAVDTRLTAPDATVGSPHYMAPEQLESSAVDLRADIYALGATAFHALAGRAPFAGLNLSQLIGAKLKGPAPEVSSICREVTPATCHLVARLLSRDPDDRPQNHRTLLAEIDAVLQQFPAPGRLVIHDTDAETEIPDLTGHRMAMTAQLSSAHTVTDQPRVPSETAAEVPVSGQRSVRRRAWFAGTVGLAVAALAAGLWLWPPRWEPLPTDRAERRVVGDVLPLFNGVSLDGWVMEYGTWGAAVDEPVLTGKHGVVTRGLPSRSRLGLAPLESRDGPPLFYRLDLLLLGLPPSSRAELHFGLSAANGPNWVRYVLQRDAAGIRLGRQVGDRGEFQAETRIATMPLPADAEAAVEVERLPNGWFVEVNGQRLGALPLESHPVPQFRLAAAGTARFAELYLQQLQPTETTVSGTKVDGGR